jgi:2-C-methyl-D-erythritol 4-phosphate cytidylyltransferase
MNMPKNSAIIVAAGRGTRMGGTLSKQYLPLDGVPILRRSLEVFIHSGLFDEIIVVVAAADMDYCRQHIINLPATEQPLRLVAGGRERQESVFNGIEALGGRDEDVILIHDGVRPFVTPDALADCCATARRHGAAILAVPARDTLKVVGGDSRITETLARKGIWQAQTPQGFRLGLIREAHHRAREEGVRGTDDAQLVERMGHRVAIIAGSRFNIKITTPEDLALAEAISLHTGGIFP